MHLIESYNNLLKKLVYCGVKTDMTKALYDETIVFDLRSLNRYNNTRTSLSRQLFLPKNRGAYSSTSTKYGTVEAIWYRQQTQEIDLIRKYAKIWDDMTDENGKVNSNYGYQLSKNNHVLAQLDSMINEASIKGQSVQEFYILSKDNQSDRHDCVCNNKIALTLRAKDDKTFLLDANVFARSIDVMFGLPYDTFTAIGFMNMVANYVEAKQHLKQFVEFNSLKFDVVNLHWYLRDSPEEHSIHNLENNVVLIDANLTPYSNFRQDFSNITQEEVTEFRNNCEEIAYISDLKNPDTRLDVPHHLFPNINKSNKTKSLKEAIRLVRYFVHDSDFALNDIRINEVKDHLETNHFDRKAVIMDQRHNIVYVYYNDRDGMWYVTMFESLEYQRNKTQHTFYTDGSYTNKVPDCYSWSFYVDKPNDETDWRSGIGTKFVKSRQVGGELKAVIKVLEYCIENSIYHFDIVHDYLGSSEIVKRSYQPRTPVSKSYLSSFEYLYSKLEEQANDEGIQPEIHFKHIRGHIGIEGNEFADYLAIQELRKRQK